MAKKKERKGLVIVVAIATTIGLGGLTGLLGTPTPQSGPQQQNTQVDPAQVVNLTGVPCLTSEEFNLQTKLTITVNGTEEPLPPNIGVLQGCTQEIHTHDADGIIHVESDVDKGYAFADFLNVLGVGLEQPGYITILTVNGETNNNDINFKLENNQEILLEFITIPSFGANATQ